MLNASSETNLSIAQLPVDQECTLASLVSYSTSDFIYDLRNALSKDVEGRSKFEDTLMSRWEVAEKHELFNYGLNCMYKLLEGDFNFSVQLNVERGEKRRKPMHFRALREPFSNLRWNFTKLKENEILFYLRCKDHSLNSDPLDRHVVAINAAPLTRGHSLLLPSINRCIPQRCEHLFDNIYIIKRPIWFAYAIVLQLTGPEQYEKFVMNITRCADYLSTHEIAHNIFFSRAQPLRTTGAIHSEDKTNVLPQLVTAYIFPRVAVIGAKPSRNFSPASLELSGCLTAYTYQFFETVTEEAALRIIGEEATLTNSRFNQICSELIQVLSGKMLVEHSSAEKTEPAGFIDVIMAHILNGLSSSEMDELRDSFQTFEMHSPRRLFSADNQQFTFEEEGKPTNLKPGTSF
ncbi:hypothetical protein X798_06540 [Onchocerca flexuosa]|uniref:GDP-D-glucose phosphorylase 1 n=1 Tax=Onchocerca flexuosa TaxID=387005 RepID=A0A238BNP0_9BILA|nr:hypothetical protein X798_06540 [Onchocerca flexuosa]